MPSREPTVRESPTISTRSGRAGAVTVGATRRAMSARSGGEVDVVVGRGGAVSLAGARATAGGAADAAAAVVSSSPSGDRDANPMPAASANHADAIIGGRSRRHRGGRTTPRQRRGSPGGAGQRPSAGGASSDQHRQ